MESPIIAIKHVQFECYNRDNKSITNATEESIEWMH